MTFSTEDIQQLQGSYEAILPRLREAETRLEDLVQRTIAAIDDKRLVRAAIRSKRIKTIESIRRRADAEHWSPKDACLTVTDLIGIRVVCNTIEDVYRFRELLQDFLPDDQRIIEQDYIARPKATGYRALHLNFHLGTGSLFPLSADDPYLGVPCEIQIRTLLQDGWAELVHTDFYKESTAFPEDLLARAHDLAVVLSAADGMASSVRARVMRKVTAPADIQLNTVTKESLAYVFANVFGRWPPEYAVQRASEACKETGLLGLEEFQAKLVSKNFRDSLDTAYQDELRVGFHLSPEEIFALVPTAVAKGDEQAIESAKELGKQEREEIDAVWRREVLSYLPGTYEEFVNALESGRIDVVEIANALDVADKCYCGETIVDPDAFVQAIAGHYGADVDDDLTATLYSGANCWINPNHPSLCSYHAYQADKDD
jgi:putative GTP pyrophosphokinase